MTGINIQPLDGAKQQPGVGVYAITLTGITKTVTHLGIYKSADEAINYAIDHVAVNNPQLHQQVIEKKGYWDVNLLYIHHSKAVEQFNYILDLYPEELAPQEQHILQPVVPQEAPKQEPIVISEETKQALAKAKIKDDKNKKIANLIQQGSLTALELEKENLTDAEYMYIYDKIK